MANECENLDVLEVENLAKRLDIETKHKDKKHGRVKSKRVLCELINSLYDKSALPVESILEIQTDENGKRMALVKWRSFNEPTWEPAENVIADRDLIEETPKMVKNGQESDDEDSFEKNKPLFKKISNKPTQIDFITDRFEIQQELGTGAQGAVYRAEDLQRNNAVVALKQVNIPTEAMREINTLIAIQKANNNKCVENIVCYREFFVAKSDKLSTHYVSMDFLDGKELFDWINDYSTAIEDENQAEEIVWHVRNFSHQLFRALKFLHANNVYHLDIKPENIMIVGQTKPVFIDFGLGCHNSADANVFNKCGAVRYGGTPDYVSVDYMVECARSQVKNTCTDEIKSQQDMYALSLSLLAAFDIDAFTKFKDYNMARLRNKNLKPKTAIPFSNRWKAMRNAKELLALFELCLLYTKNAKIENLTAFLSAPL